MFPLLVELVQLRKQAAERLVKEFRRLCAQAKLEAQVAEYLAFLERFRSSLKREEYGEKE